MKYRVQYQKLIFQLSVHPNLTLLMFLIVNISFYSICGNYVYPGAMFHIKQCIKRQKKNFSLKSFKLRLITKN